MASERLVSAGEGLDQQGPAGIFLASLQVAERTIKAGMLQRKTPLVRVSEIARVSKLLESSQKPVTLKAIAEFFDQAGHFEKYNKCILESVLVLVENQLQLINWGSLGRKENQRSFF